MLFFSDAQGQILAFSRPVAGNHHDLYEVEKMTDGIFDDLRSAGLRIDGLFMNADAGFDSQKFRSFCKQNGVIPNFDINKRNRKESEFQVIKDEKLYKERFVVERANAWIDSYKALLTRFEKLICTWETAHYMACVLMFVKKHF